LSRSFTSLPPVETRCRESGLPPERAACHEGADLIKDVFREKCEQVPMLSQHPGTDNRKGDAAHREDAVV